MYQSQWAPTSANSSSRRKNSANKRHHGGPSKKDSRATPTAWTDPALKEIDEVANSMEVDIQTSQITTGCASIVLDTNILLRYLNVVQQFANDVEKAGEPVYIVIPGIVVQELDYQKSNESKDLCWAARLASTWILAKLKERRNVKGQAYPETLQQSGTWKRRDPDTTNDELIVDCCLYLRERKFHQVLAISQDNNFCNASEAQGIPTLNPRGTHQWSSKTLARFIFGDNYPRLYLFSDSKELFRPKRIQEALDKELGLVTEHVDQDGMQDEGMGMEIDDGWLVSDEPPPQHILDDLHDQIIDHFSILLRELLERAFPSLFVQSGSTASIYAPVNSKPAEGWKANEIIQYLCNERRIPQNSATEDVKMVTQDVSRFTDFFTRKYDVRGRSGQHWARADWNSSLRKLGALARIYEDGAIQNSLSQLSWQIDMAFESPICPTGTGLGLGLPDV